MIRASWVVGAIVANALVAEVIHERDPSFDAPRSDSSTVRDTTIEITFGHGAVVLAGTVTLPAGAGPHPAVVLISGSGAQNRDEELYGFKPFAVIAHHLARHGIATLRYDDRGVGGSTGSFATATTMDFVDDVAAALGALAARDDIRPDAIGLLGHSEGGVVAPLVAQAGHPVAFMVLLAPAAVRGDSVLFSQGAAIARALGASPDDIAAQRRRQARLFAAIRTGVGWDALERDWTAQLHAAIDSLPASRQTALGDRDTFVAQQVAEQLAQGRSPWFHFFIDFDPAAAFTAVRVPVLCLFGAVDLQVLPAVNAPAARRAFTAGDNPDWTVEVLPRANHLFQAAETGSPAEYPRLAKAFVPTLLPRITAWIAARTGAAP